MYPFIPTTKGTQRLLVGTVSAFIAVTPGRQVVLKASNFNTDFVYVEFVTVNTTLAVVPVVGTPGGFVLGPGDMVELTVPDGTGPDKLLGQFLAHISGTAAQGLFVSQGADG